MPERNQMMLESNDVLCTQEKTISSVCRLLITITTRGKINTILHIHTHVFKSSSKTKREREKTRAYFRKVTITSRRIRMLNGIERIYKNTKFSFFFFLASIFLSHLSNYAVFFHSSIPLTRWTNITFALNLIYLQRRKK